jgi:Zn-dependent peptidase ImmA (M78 family)
VDERYHPWRHARELGVKVVDRPLGDELWGYYDHRRQRAVLNSRLCQFERRCTLAHEIVHHERGDDCGLDEREETAVHVVAAHRLIPLGTLAAALLTFGEDLHALADELWVDVATLRIRLEHLHPVERAVIRRRLAEKPEAA